MDESLSTNSILIRLTDERWNHITEGHPEMVHLQEQVLATITNPQFICAGDDGELKAVSDLNEDGKVIVVVYKETSDIDGFVITAHLGRSKTLEKLLKREIVWKRES